MLKSGNQMSSKTSGGLGARSSGGETVLWPQCAAPKPCAGSWLPSAPGLNSEKHILNLWWLSVARPSTHLNPPREARHLRLLLTSHLSISRWWSPGSLPEEQEPGGAGGDCVGSSIHRGKRERGEGLSVYRKSQHSGGLLASALRNQRPGDHGLVCQDVPRVKTI